MTKIVRKLVASILTLAILLVMVVAVSYAWQTLSVSPEARGIQISLGGGNTILLAPDTTEIENGNIYHYPGKFTQNLNFNHYDQYAYLGAIDGLMPVSTADGLHWYLPTYYSADDEAVINGTAVVGQLKPISEFLLDQRLSYANLTDPEAAKLGSYVYLDFWVVSPGADYDLRISRGDDDEGSFLIELMQPVENESGGYDLAATSGSVASSVRVGFLVDHNTVLDDTMLYYTASGNCPSEYTSLRGSYQEMGEHVRYSSAYRFTIYEPNADIHPKGADGTYVVTRPIAWDGGEAVLADISDRLTVQTANRWSKGENEEFYLQEIFKTAVTGKSYSSATEAKIDFYSKYLQGKVYPYVDQGRFIASTAALYDSAESGVVSAEAMSALEMSGATVDRCVASLEKNVPQRIRMFVWVEGQDADCVGIEETVSFTLGIELAGGQTSINGRSKQED